MQLAGRVAVVTGGGSGIGAAIVRLFAREGAQVVVADVDAEKADSVAGAVGDAALAVPTDVTDVAQVDALFARAVERFGTVDVLVNNAGIAQLSPELRERFQQATEALVAGERRSFDVTSRMGDAEWRRMIDVHLFGTFACTRAALRLMEARGGGAIVNMASVAGLQGLPGVPHYSAAKAGIIGFTKAVAQEVGPHIRVNAIAPGYVDTPMTADMPELAKRFAIMRTPLARTAAPDEIAAVALFLASDAASFVTGEVVSVNGGLYT